MKFNVLRDGDKKKLEGSEGEGGGRERKNERE